ncbi:MAG TPA: peptidase [Planctomycetaceae bacterium]|nr:peptidase [Planctomycetaceae bacterium]
MFTRCLIRSFEVGLLFRDDEFVGLLAPGRHRFFDLFRKVRVDVVSQREPELVHEQLDQIVKSGGLEGQAVVLELKEHERALVWIDNRFSRVLSPGLYAYWTGQRQVRTEVVDARTVRFEHTELKAILASASSRQNLDAWTVGRNSAGVLYHDGQYQATLTPGTYAFWKGQGEIKVIEIDLRENQVDIAGQDLMTADRVTLRINAVVTFRVVDPERALSQSNDLRGAVYREAQLVLRSVVGARELDQFLTDREAVSRELEETLRGRSAELGLELASVGIRDVILPGEMKELMNRVTAARREAEANLILRREETAAMRSQANTAKLLAESPALMRLRELETLERIASAGKLNVVVSDKGLTETVTRLL